MSKAAQKEKPLVVEAGLTYANKRSPSCTFTAEDCASVGGTKRWYGVNEHGAKVMLFDSELVKFWMVVR